jgi:ABC-type methionine transport system permease subunit
MPERTPRLPALAGQVLDKKDTRWVSIWCGAMGVLFLWDAAFLNAPAFAQLRAALLNTILGGALVIVFSGVMGWIAGVGRHFLSEFRFGALYTLLDFLLNLVRSVPQFIGILVGYIVITQFIQSEALVDPYLQIFWTSMVISVFVFLEFADLIRERISYYTKLDFVNAMLVCGISEGRIINWEILWKNSLSHIIHKLISVFGIAIFLQCSIDFIISVGLSRDVSAGNFPVTLGSVLAKLDSKQDILAIGKVLTDPGYISDLVVYNLQGVSAAFAIVFTLLCVYHVANGYVKRHNL